MAINGQVMFIMVSKNNYLDNYRLDTTLNL